MLSILKYVVIVASIIAACLGFWLALRRYWPATQRREHNDIIGWQFSILGTTYAVILAFMLWNVWNSFQIAQTNAEVEANSLVDLYRLAPGLPPEQASQVRTLTREYARIAVAEEWPAMAQEAFSPNGFSITQKLWETLVKKYPEDCAQQTTTTQAFAALTNMTEHRRLRQLESRTKLPGILWAVLIVGALVVFGSACLFACHNFALHFVQVFVLALLLSLVLVAIAQIDRPFQGPLHVQPDAFVFALQTFDQPP
jgi:hypothetical protein